METSDRPLAYVQTIQELNPIAGADVIECARVLGWHVIVKKGVYKPGDPVVYVEIDSILPPWPAFINDKLDRYNFRIKTITLKKQISQGYCISFPTLAGHPDRKMELTTTKTMTEGGELELQALRDLDTNEIITLEPNKDLTSYIGIKKYEIQNTVNVNGKVKQSTFPSFFPKTDQVRIQNLPDYPTYYGDVEFEVTEKLEGTSISAYFHDGKFGICSRNLLLIIEPDSDSVAIKTLLDRGVQQALESYGKSIALQGELIGPGIQLNIYGLKDYQWRVFDIYLILEKRHATSAERIQILKDLKLEDCAVPILTTKKIGGMTVDEILRFAEGTSVLKKGVQREGVVFKSCEVVNGRVINFKAVSNSYELKKAKE
eukprot:Phypoly_transcript_10955.p1 GENE.Phypoly_transcript_10955~~Phypoly_transcript_10955.p1  ORF type:complete len:411 (+),score=58.41 Phypoly_transcript_10955:115-1233(+)